MISESDQEQATWLLEQLVMLSLTTNIDSLLRSGGCVVAVVDTFTAIRTEERKKAADAVRGTVRNFGDYMDYEIAADELADKIERGDWDE